MGGGPRVVINTAAFHARVRGSVLSLGGLEETQMFLPHPRVKHSYLSSLFRTKKIPVEMIKRLWQMFSWSNNSSCNMFIFINKHMFASYFIIIFYQLCEKSIRHTCLQIFYVLIVGFHFNQWSFYLWHYNWFTKRQCYRRCMSISPRLHNNEFIQDIHVLFCT